MCMVMDIIIIYCKQKWFIIICKIMVYIIYIIYNDLLYIEHDNISCNKPLQMIQMNMVVIMVVIIMVLLC